MFNNMEEARTTLHTSVSIIDNYVQALIRKDTLILAQDETIAQLRRRIEELEYASELPKSAEVSQ